MTMPITARTVLQTGYGPFDLNHHTLDGQVYVSLVRGDIKKNSPIVRLQSACLFGTAFHSRDCECKAELDGAFECIATEGYGVIVYSSAEQEGRGVGLKTKIEAMEIRRKTGCSSHDDLLALGLEKSDYRDYRYDIQTLQELEVCKDLRILGTNGGKREALEKAGFKVSSEFAFLNKWQAPQA
jgi:GTP cyclohydrolase II